MCAIPMSEGDATDLEAQTRHAMTRKANFSMYSIFTPEQGSLLHAKHVLPNP